jgi:GGDEF domain-containing protein
VKDRVTLTVSAGVASAPRDGVDVAAFVRAADQRLLAAKRAGRNRLVSC